ncbi:hypothetical protein CRU99_12420, partial [Malaciobacter mytili]|uniref:hypothetical protein n=1 Tax=Malaciobacter mytili TaxID=603050 RepID=UPI0010286F38
MLTMTIKYHTGNIQIKTITKDLILDPLKGEQFFIDNSEGRNYNISLIDDNKSVQVTVETTPQIKIIFKNFVNLISDLEDKESAIGILNNKEGLKELNQIVLNPVPQSGDIINNLKELLASSSLENISKNGIIIDDFYSLTEALKASAEGNSTISNSSTFFNDFELENNASYDLNGRTKLQIDSVSSSKENLDSKRKILVEEETPIEETLDNLNVKLSGASSVVEGEEATYKVSLTDDAGKAVKAIEDMSVTFKYTYTSASGEDITEVKTVIVKAGESEVSFNV